MKTSTILGILSTITFASAACTGPFTQCGGKNFHGSNCCVEGYTCQFINDWYSRCSPSTEQNASKTSSTPSNNAVNNNTKKSFNNPWNNGSWNNGPWNNGSWNNGPFNPFDFFNKNNNNNGMNINNNNNNVSNNNMSNNNIPNNNIPNNNIPNNNIPNNNIPNNDTPNSNMPNSNMPNSNMPNNNMPNNNISNTNNKTSNNATNNNIASSTPVSLKVSNYSSGVSVHDPSVVKDGNTYYIFGSHMDTASSNDLWTWKKLYTGVNENNRMFNNLFSKSNYAPFSYVGKNDEGGYSVWAPDVMFNKKMGKWVQYFCTTSTFIKSNLCYATADRIEGPYNFQSCFLYSGFVGNTVGQTNLKTITGGTDGNRYYPNNEYNFHTYPNAIDPSVFYDFGGKLWMTYGSWSGGIYILELDEATGLPKHNVNNGNNIDKYFGKKLAGGNHQSIEGPYILPYQKAGYYYLFVSYGGLTSNGGYQIRMFRSKNPDGPYVDARGKEFMSGKNSEFGIKVMGNYNLPGLSKAYMAPGHNSAILDNNKVLLVYHTRFNDGQEYHEPRVHQMFLNEDGWLCAAPYAYTGETVSPTGYTMEEMTGAFKIVFHDHNKINADVSNPVTVTLESNFVVTGKHTGTWGYTENSNFMHIKIGNVNYKGVFLTQQDEAKSANVVVFTAVGDNNDSIWGVKAL